MGNGKKSSLTNPGFAIGVALIFAGTLLFVENLGLFHFDVVRLFWPILFLFYGAAALRSSRNPVSLVWGSAALIAGGLLLLNSFHVLYVSMRLLWPLVLIASGVTMLIYRLQWQRSVSAFTLGSSTEMRSSADRVHEFAIFSGAKRKIDSPNFEGGDLSSLFGGIEIDLRRAKISGITGEAVIDANAAFGGIEIRIPETWRVSLQGTAVFGAYEDKTLPPRPEPGVVNPVLVIRGGTAFGAVSIQN